MRGGARPGAGRRPGSTNRFSSEAREKAQQSGELPHEFLLRVSRGAEVDGHQPTFQERVDAAKGAAPYFAPKLAAIEYVPERKPFEIPKGIDVRCMSNADLWRGVLGQASKNDDTWEAFLSHPGVAEALRSYINAAAAQRGVD